MTYLRRFWAQIALLILSVFGVAVSIYLAISHYQNAPVACSTSGFVNCERVLNSIYGYVPYTKIPISIPGLLYFVAYGILAFLLWRVWPERKLLVIGEVVLSVLGLLTAFYLIYVELVILHTICAWCTTLHVAIFLSLLVSVYQLLQIGNDDDYEYEDEEEGEVASPVSTSGSTN